MALPVRDFGPGDAIGPGARVEVDRRGSATRYFIGPRACGTEIVHAGKTMLVLTP